MHVSKFKLTKSITLFSLTGGYRSVQFDPQVRVGITRRRQLSIKEQNRQFESFQRRVGNHEDVHNFKSGAAERIRRGLSRKEALRSVCRYYHH